jgi:hypothetical protein
MEHMINHTYRCAAWEEILQHFEENFQSPENLGL